MSKVIEYDHEKILEVLKIVNDFAQELLLDPKTIKFLPTYFF